MRVVISRFKSSKLLQSLSANAIGQLLNVFIQLLGVPILINAFGVRQYGEYLVLSSIPSFLLYADLGLAISLGNQITTLYTRKKFTLTRILCDTYVIFTLSSSFILILIGVFTSLFFNFRKGFNLTLFEDLHYGLIFFILLVTVLISHVTGIVGLFLRALNKNALGVNILTSQRVLIIISFWISAIISKSVIVAALCSLICSALIIISVFIWYEFKYSEKLPIRFKKFSKKKLKESVKPGLSFLLIAIGNSLLLQGTTIIVNKFLGSTLVVLFNSTRTLSNFIKQGIVLINSSIWIEYNILLGSNNWLKIKRLFSISTKISIALAIAFSSLAIIFGEFVFQKWIGGKVKFNITFFSLMILINIFYAGWSTASILPFAMNKFKFIGAVFFTISIISLVLIYLLGFYFNLLMVIPVILIFGEIAMIALVYPFSKKQILFDDGANSIR